MQYSESSDFVVVNASEVVTAGDQPMTMQRIENGAVAVRGGKIAFVGAQASLPESLAGDGVIDARGSAVLPGLVDCHTHLVFGGDRVEDFSRRAKGMTYAEIAAEGGGILTTVEATRKTPLEDLIDAAEERLLRRRRFGIACTEIKSGYGLTVEYELRMLGAVKALKGRGFDVEATLLGAHSVPKDVPRDAYVASVIEEMIPTVAQGKLARFVDVFVEKGAFTVDEARRIFEAGKAHGLLPRVHADQITSGGGAELAASVGAVSADHLEHISDAGVAQMADAGVVGVLLPGALTYLGDHTPGLGRRLIDGGVSVAVATDMNPGSSPTNNLPLMATLAVTRFGLSVDEALWAVTAGGAHVLRRPDLGRLQVGAKGAVTILTHSDARALVSSFGEPIVAQFVSA